MKHAGMLPFRTALCNLALLAVSAQADSALYNEYCSSQNSGSGNGPYFNIYNSMGSCSTKCRAQYAFAIVQGQNCWCSDYIPSNQASTSECNSPCPGYPDNLCGNPDDGLYGYVPLDKPPSGTAGGSSSQRTTTPSADRTPTAQDGSSLSSSYAPSSSSSSDTTSTKSLVMTQVTTISGNAVTQTVTTTPINMSPNTASSDDPPALEKTGLSGGEIAGVVIGTLLGVAFIALAAFLLWRRRRNSDTEGGGTGSSPKRKGSVLSRAGLLGTARPQSMAETNYDDPYSADPMTRTNSVRHSMMFGGGLTAEGIAPAGPLGSASDSGSEKRQSKPMVYDQRLNPSALWAHHDNGSRVSMQDQQDYSRPLGLANPDYARTHSFDSR